MVYFILALPLSQVIMNKMVQCINAAIFKKQIIVKMR